MPSYSKVHFVCHLGVVPWSLAAARAARPGAQGLSKHTKTQERLTDTPSPSQLRAGAPAHGRRHAAPGLRNSAADSPEATDGLGLLEFWCGDWGRQTETPVLGTAFWHQIGDHTMTMAPSGSERHLGEDRPGGLTTIDLIFTNTHNRMA